MGPAACESPLTLLVLGSTAHEVMESLSVASAKHQQDPVSKSGLPPATSAARLPGALCQAAATAGASRGISRCLKTNPTTAGSKAVGRDDRVPEARLLLARMQGYATPSSKIIALSAPKDRCAQQGGSALLDRNGAPKTAGRRRRLTANSYAAFSTADCGKLDVHIVKSLALCDTRTVPHED